jgi:signal transduction histidine kinase
VTDEALSAYPDDKDFRKAALAAFAHELRTPLTALRMVAELGRDPNSRGLAFDDELAGMFFQSLDDIEALANGVQDVSRVEREILRPGVQRTSLAAGVEQAVARVPPAVRLEAGVVVEAEGPWEPGLGAGLAGLAEGAYRGGDGSGLVTLESAVTDAGVEVTLLAGEPTGERRAVDASLGFRFFAGRLLLVEMGAAVSVQRSSGHVRVRVLLPG